KQGYSVQHGVIHMPKDPSKDDYRALNEMAVRKKFEKSGPGVQRYEDGLLTKYIANGQEIQPREITPKVILVQPESEHELLFRYACLHWSIPVSAGYGRRLRFLVTDESNGKLIGLFGLGDPVYAMQARDQWIGWDRDTKAQRLYHVMDAYVLGAVPPYSFLLGGKLVAMLVCSNEVRNAFRRKYNGHESLIRKETKPPYLVLITTTSALGRSSIYNRIHVNGQKYWTSVGFTQGSGEFHFSNGVYEEIRAYVDKRCEPTAKHEDWGSGFRNKREVVRKCLSRIGLSADLIYHGIRREIFAAPLGREALCFLRGEVERPCFRDWPASELAKLFAERWLLSRAERMPAYREYDREEYRLWAPRKPMKRTSS
ncbi:MAG: Druantia anti-phage system protein DruA, partial [Candidatus Brocadiia bacterium]